MLDIFLLGYVFSPLFALSVIGTALGIYYVSRTREKLERVQYLLFNLFGAIAIGFIASQVTIGLEEIQMQYATYILTFLASAYYSYVTARRLSDIGWSVWLGMLISIPILNLLFALVLVVWPGKPDQNREKVNEVV